MLLSQLQWGGCGTVNTLVHCYHGNFAEIPEPRFEEKPQEKGEILLWWDFWLSQHTYTHTLHKGIADLQREREKEKFLRDVAIRVQRPEDFCDTEIMTYHINLQVHDPRCGGESPRTWGLPGGDDISVAHSGPEVSRWVFLGFWIWLGQYNLFGQCPSWVFQMLF